MRTAAQKARLIKLAEHMAFVEPETFTMVRYESMCGTPACVFGHARTIWPALCGIDYWDRSVNELFGLSDDDDEYIFSKYEYTVSFEQRAADTPSIAASRIWDVLLADA